VIKRSSYLEKYFDKQPDIKFAASQLQNQATEAKIRYYKDVTLCENYVRDFFIAAILPVSVKFNAINLLILKMQRHQSRRHFGSK
jgi:hypothetical protein